MCISIATTSAGGSGSGAAVGATVGARLGAVVGAQFGSRAGALLRGEQLRGLLALLVLAVCVKIGYDLVVRPEDLLSVELVR